MPGAETLGATLRGGVVTWQAHIGPRGVRSVVSPASEGALRLTHSCGALRPVSLTRSAHTYGTL